MITFHPRALVVTVLLVAALLIASAAPARAMIVAVLGLGALAWEVWYVWLGRGRDRR